jgi:hypothetical protein
VRRLMNPLTLGKTGTLEKNTKKFAFAREFL